MWFSPWRRILRGRSGDTKPSGLRAGTKFVEEDTGVEYTYDPIMKDWKKEVAPYSAIVCKDGSTVWAEDASGKTIASGEAGVDDASVIQSALNQGGKVFISAGTYRVGSGKLMIKSNCELIGEGKNKTILEIYYDGIHYVNFPPGGKVMTLITNEGATKDPVETNEDFAIRNLTITLDHSSFQSAGVSSRSLVFVNCKHVEIENVDFEKILLRYMEGSGQPGGLFFFDTNAYAEAGAPHINEDIKVKGCRFTNYVTLEGDNIDTVFKVQGKDVWVENCWSDAEGADGKPLSKGFNYNITWVEKGVFKDCYGRMAKAGVWIELAGNQTYSDIQLRNIIIEDTRAGGIGVSSTVSEDSKIIVRDCSVRRAGTIGIDVRMGSALGCEVYEHGQRATSGVYGISGKRIIGCKVVAKSNEYQLGFGVQDDGELINCRAECYGFALNPYQVSNARIIGCTFKRVTTDIWTSGKVQLRYCNNIFISNCYFDNSYISILYDGTNGKGHVIKNNIFNSPGESAAITYGNTVPVDLIIEGNDFRRVGGTAIHSDIQAESTNYIKRNKGYATENSGTATFSGDGSTTDFEIGAHGLVTTDPSKIAVKITPVSSDAIAASPCIGYVDPADNTKIRVKFASAPASGSNNVQIVWHAEVI